MAMCYSDLSKPREAIGCLKRALVDNSSNTLIHSKIASLYHALGEPKSASVWERGIISIGSSEGELSLWVACVLRVHDMTCREECSRVRKKLHVPCKIPHWMCHCCSG